MIRFVSALVIAAAYIVLPAAAQIDEAPKVHVRFIPEADSVAAGGTIAVALEENIRPGWHTYWSNPGDAGAPTEIQWTLPAGWSASSIEWPYPKKLPVGPLMDYGYEGNTWLLLKITAPKVAAIGSTAQLKAAVSWLVCREVCVPEDASLILRLGVTAQPGLPDANNARQFQIARARIPVASPWPVRYALNDTLDLFVAAPELSHARPVSAVFFPMSGREIKSTAPQTLGFTNDGLLLTLTPSRKFNPGSPLVGVLVLTSADGSIQALNVDARAGVVPRPALFASDMTFVLALLFALLGGVILNLMPCVLPILAMKALAVASHAGAGRKAIRSEGFAYGAGAILSFVALGLVLEALKAGGAAVGWGFQLQEPAVVGCFALLMVAVGLNFSGVYEIAPIPAGDALTRRSGVTGNFFTGVLAVAVAAPCTVPFMATAVGYALTQSALIAISVFAILGIGFAAPFLLLGFWPVLQRFLPRPGAWMVTLRQILAFPMYAAAAWLVWVLGLQTDANGVGLVLAAMVVMAFALWLWGTTRSLSPRGRTFGAALALAVFLASLAPLAALRHGSAIQSAQPVRTALSTTIPSEPFTQARLGELRRAHRAIFVNATAAWCITCLVNDQRVLSDTDVKTAFARQRVAYLLADWTNRNSEITALLQEHGRSGVPLYLYYAPGATDAKILSQVLTVREVTSTIESGNGS
jgi:thiol:disulfide interchange protein/DsbC/DsbD-like thiol-disulfide interchange protein